MPKRKTKKGIKKRTDRTTKKRIKKRINRKTKKRINNKKRIDGGGPRWDRARDSIHSAGDIAIQSGSTAIGRIRQGVSSTAQWLAGNAGFPEDQPIEDLEPDPNDPSYQCYLYYRNTHTHTFPHRVFIDYDDILTQVKDKIAEETGSYSPQRLQLNNHLMTTLITLIIDYTRSNSAFRDEFRDEYEEMFETISDGQYNSELVDVPPQHAWVINTFIHIINGMDLFDGLFAEQDTSAKIEYETYVEEYIPTHSLGGSGTHPPDSIDCPRLFKECDSELFEEFPLPKPHYEYEDDIKRIIEPDDLIGDIKNRIKYFIISHYITDGALRRYLEAMHSNIVRPSDKD